MSRDDSAVDVSDPVLLVRINQLYRADMSELELYEATRGVWKVGGPRRKRVKYALAVFEGIVREVYMVDAWTHAGPTRYQTREFEDGDFEGRWEFNGRPAPEEIRARYVGHERPAHSPHEYALIRIRELFHGLIRSRAREGGIPIPRNLPGWTISSLMNRNQSGFQFQACTEASPIGCKPEGTDSSSSLNPGAVLSADLGCAM